MSLGLLASFWGLISKTVIFYAYQIAVLAIKLLLHFAKPKNPGKSHQTKLSFSLDKKWIWGQGWDNW